MSITLGSNLSIKGNGKWRSCGSVYENDGTPASPALNVNSSGNLAWAPVTGTAGAALSYKVVFDPAGPTATVTGTTATVSGYQSGISYSINVYAVNIAGRGKISNTVYYSTSYNNATGGTVTEINNYNGSGQTWRVHTFTSDGTFTVASAPQSFNVLAVGGGYAGQQGGYGGGGAGGNGGRIYNGTYSLPVGANSVSIGAANGGATVVGPLSTATDSNFQASGGPGVGGFSAGNPGSSGVVSTITGSSATYGGGGGSGGAGYYQPQLNVNVGFAGGPGGAGGGANGGQAADGNNQNGRPGGNAAANTGGGGGGGGGHSDGNPQPGSGGSGGSGIVIIAYQIAPPSNFNNAVGGDSVYSYDDGNGRVYRVHEFTNSGTFQVLQSNTAFDILAVGGGGGSDTGEHLDPNVFRYNASGGGAEVIALDTQTLPVSSYAVTIGNGGASAAEAGQNTTFGAIATARGGGASSVGGPPYVGGTSGNGNAGYSTNAAGESGNGGGAGGAATSNAFGSGVTSSITGVLRTYGSGQPDSGPGTPGIPGTNIAGTGVGKKGIVYVRYQIAGSTTFNSATGGTETFVADYNGTGTTWKIHTFTSSGTFTVTNAVAPFRVLVAAGGGGVGYNNSSATSGGGGAGGLLQDDSFALSATGYPVVVGAGGAGGFQTYGQGGGSQFASLSAIGGGAGVEFGNAGSGGSGGGGGGDNNNGSTGGSGTPGQGFGGGGGTYGGPGGGGGAGGPGQQGTDRYDPQGCSKGIGGPGLTSNIRGVPEVFSAGGRASVGSIYGQGGFGGCGGSVSAGGQGVVIIAYRIA